MHKAEKTQRGFTLIELSIVLVIIGLIVGGVLVGRDLIHAAQIRSTLAQIDSFNAATNAFVTKYNCLPGDCANATTFWGTTGECLGNDVGLGSNTCNGDGNGMISSAGYAEGNSYVRTENVLFWQQLGLAGMMAPVGGWTKMNDPTSYGPPAKIPNTCIGVAWGFPDDGWNGYAPPELSGAPQATGHFFRLGSPINQPGTGPNDCLSSNSFDPQTASNIDQKIDDGQPTSGNVMGVFWYGWYAPGGCMITSGPNYTYNTSSASPVCAIVIKSAF